MITFSLCASLCCPEDDIPAQEFFIENDNLISVENNSNSFSLNDQFTIETVIANNQIDTGGNAIAISDLFYSDILNDSFLQHSLILYRETGFGTLSPISILEEDVQTSTGTTDVSNEFITVRSYYDAMTNSFRSKFSITLKESGTFFLSDNRFGFNDFRGITISGGIFELGFVQINTSINNANTDGAFEITVIE